MTINQLIEQRYGLPTTIDEQIETSPTIIDILDRRSCRQFKSQSIDENLIDVLFSAAFSAPSKSDLQQACVVRVKDHEKQLRIASLCPNSDWITEAPLFMVWCGDSRRIRRAAEFRQHPFANDHLDTFMNSAVDVGIAMQTFIIAAESVGLGCCPVSELRNQVDTLSEELQLPDYVFPVVGLCIGWPVQPKTISMRLPLEVTVHQDCYDDSQLEQQIDDYDKRRQAREKSQMKTVVEEPVSWSEARTQQYSVPARTNFGDYIRRQKIGLS